MHEVELKVKAVGINGDPLVRISINDAMAFDDRWHGSDIKKFIMPLSTNNRLLIEHYGKKFGENRIWDQYEFVLQEIWLDDVPISKLWQSGKKLYYHNGETIPDDLGPVDMVFGFNGSFELEFTAPVYDWIIDRRKIVMSPVDIKISSLDYYNRQYTNHAEIQRMFTIIDEKLSKL